MTPALQPRAAALLVLAGAVATIAGALLFEHGFGYVPCKLCLTERQPYYAAMPIALAAALLPARAARLRRGLLAVVALVFLVGAALGTWHAGAEWGYWPGPSDCGGGTGAPPSGVGDFLKSLEGVKVVSCTEAAWRFLGLSLAGWNVLISLGLAGLAGTAALRAR